MATRKPSLRPPRTPKCLRYTLLCPHDKLVTGFPRIICRAYRGLGVGVFGMRGTYPLNVRVPARTGVSQQTRRPCTCVHVASRLAGRMRARPDPGMLTQPGCSHPFRATRMPLVLPPPLQDAESEALVAAGPLALGGPLRHSLLPSQREPCAS